MAKRPLGRHADIGRSVAVGASEHGGRIRRDRALALYGTTSWLSLAVVAGGTAVFMIAAILAYDPSRGSSRRGPAGGET